MAENTEMPAENETVSATTTAAAQATAPIEAESAAPIAAEAEAAVGPDTTAEAATEVEPITSIEPEPPAPPKPKRSIKTRRLFAGAVALGLIGGAVGGYTIQALRKPTPLPPLSVTQPAYPRGAIYAGTRPPALPASQDDATVVNGDLTKLLLPTPAGASVGFLDHSWMSLESEAETCDNAASCFSTNMHDGVVRIADTSWKRSDGLYVEIRIIQHRPGDTVYADSQIADMSGKNYTKLRMPDGIPAAGYEYVDSDGANDDHAVAVHGDLAVFFWVTSATRVPDPSVIDDLIKQQMARL